MGRAVGSGELGGHGAVFEEVAVGVERVSGVVEEYESVEAEEGGEDDYKVFVGMQVCSMMYVSSDDVMNGLKTNGLRSSLIS